MANEPQRFRMPVLGIGDAFTERRRTTSAVLLAGGSAARVDCGSSRRALGEASERSGVRVRSERLAHVPDDFDVAGAAVEVLEEGRLYDV